MVETMTISNSIMATKVEPIPSKAIETEPEIVVAAAIPQGEALIYTPTSSTPLNAQQKQPKRDPGFDILCCGDDKGPTAPGFFRWLPAPGPGPRLRSCSSAPLQHTAWHGPA